MQHPTNKRKPTRAASLTSRRPKWRPDLELDPKISTSDRLSALFCSPPVGSARLAHRIHRQRCALECRQTTELLAAHNSRPIHHKIAHQFQHQTPPKPGKKNPHGNSPHDGRPICSVDAECLPRAADSSPHSQNHKSAGYFR
uniref:(northern house mosquito) hypothetical protein n=1 Tax=Culex pipiens TaxID=7175 RepID=A0A8D8A8J5_CULPI